jgi:RNA polymerase sigma-70 factor, ECF subfamily
LGLKANSSVAETNWEGDRAKAFAGFMRAHQDMVYSTAVRILGNEAQAQDLAQEVFLKAYQHFDQLRGSVTAAGWLKTVGRNLSLNHVLRYRKRWRFFSELSSDDAAGAELEVPAPDTLLAGIDAERRSQLIEHALQRLPDHQRLPLVLYHFEDMPYEEIADQLQISLAKVKIDLLRGRAALARLLARAGVDPSAAS